jgi:hypothetical protein
MDKKWIKRDRLYGLYSSCIELQSVNVLYQQTSEQLEQTKKSLEAQVETTMIEPNTDDDLEIANLRIQALVSSNEVLYQQLLSKDEEIKKLLVTTPVSPPDEQLDLNDEMERESTLSDNNNPMLGKDVYGKIFYSSIL